MKSAPRPYERVAEGLRRRIAAGEWRPGEMIPGRRALAAHYGVAPATLERAAGMLIAEGLIYAMDDNEFFVKGSESQKACDGAGLQAMAQRTRQEF